MINGGTGGAGVSWNGYSGGNGGNGGDGRFLAQQDAELTIPTAPSSVSSDPSSLCDGTGNITLTATGGSGATLNWYASTGGSTVIGTGTPLTIASPSVTTTYYAAWTSGSCNGTSSYTSVTVTVGGCTFNYTVSLFLQGYYLGSNKMSPLLRLLGASNASAVDTVTIELHRDISPYDSLYAYKGVVASNGNINCSFAGGALNGSFYIVVKHRNSIDTWSNGAQTIGSNGTYNFTTSAAAAFGSNLVNLEGNVYGIYSGDVNRDGALDSSDKLSVQIAVPSFTKGMYDTNDVTGDGFVDESDYRVLENNAPLGVTVSHP